jgi:hypothetical protein
MKNISKSLGYPILDDVIILMARVKGNLRTFVNIPIASNLMAPLGMRILQYHLLYGYSGNIAYFAIPYSLTSFSLLDTQSIS